MLLPRIDRNLTNRCRSVSLKHKLRCTKPLVHVDNVHISRGFQRDGRKGHFVWRGNEVETWQWSN